MYQSQHANATQEKSRSSAHTLSSHHNGISLQPPAQLKLQVGRSYYAIKEEEVYPDETEVNSSGKTVVDTLYSPLKHEIFRTKLKQHTDETIVWTDTRPDHDDPSYY